MRAKRLEALRIKKEKALRKRNEKEERGKMRHEDYDVTDILAGLVEPIVSEDEGEEESEVYLDDDSFFEVIEDPKESGISNLEKSYLSGRTGKTGKTGKTKNQLTGRSGKSRNQGSSNNLNRQGTRITVNNLPVNRANTRLSRMPSRNNTLLSRGETLMSRGDTIRGGR